ncbi:MAG: hypothetical protein LUF32_06365 [Clostridiales bacterium]|nr:hypothetical protein [Clostridiales bacterium]
MGERAIDNRVRKLQELENQIAQLQEQADTIKDEIKADMESKGIDEIKTKNFIVRWKEIISNRFDSKAFKAAQPELYTAYTRETASRRFTIA